MRGASRWSSLRRGFAAAWGTLVALAVGTAFAAPDSTPDLDTDEVPSIDDYERLRNRGRDAYNEENYERAETYYVEAIQAAPDNPRGYLHLARTFFWRKDYVAAVAYYDFYIETASDGEVSDKVTSERRLAASRSGDAVWKVPETQKRILESLRTKLNEGRAYTEGGGGAWGLYRTLLRTDYAHPDLATLRTRLRKKLIDEFDTRMEPASGEPTPEMSLSAWKRQLERLEAAHTLADPADREDVESRTHIAEAAVSLLNGRAEEAAARAEKAVEAHPERPALKWLHAAALVEAGRYDQAEEALNRYASDLAATPTMQSYVDTLRATLDRRRGDLKRAAEAYYRLLDESRR